MIDYLTCSVPVSLSAPICAGHIVQIDKAGEIEIATPRRLAVTGSHNSSIFIRAPGTDRLSVQGNLTKWLHGHNLYGPDDDLPGLLRAVLERLEPVLAASHPESAFRCPADLSQTTISRIDLTEMVLLNSLADVHAYIRSAYVNGTMANRGRGHDDKGTLIFGYAKGKSFTRSQVVIYAKGPETLVHPLPSVIASDPELRAWVDRCLRVEVRFGRHELEDRKLRHLGAWSQLGRDGYAQLRESIMDKLHFNTVAEEQFDVMTLPMGLRSTYISWKAGADIRSLMSRASYFRHRKQLLDLINTDIAVPLPVVPTAQIVPIRRVLTWEPAGRPDFADRIDALLSEAA